VKGDAIAALEAAYDVDTSEHAWLKRLASAVRPHLDPGLGVFAYTWSVRAGKLEVRTFTSVDCALTAGAWRRALRRTTPPFVRAWISVPFGMVRAIRGSDGLSLGAHGWEDIVSLNARGPNGSGCTIALPTRAPRRLRPRDETDLRRIAKHIAAGLTLRARLAVVHEASGPESLSDREREVLALAAAQQTNKHIAYQLGLSDSTVRVLLTRACRKLGARSRPEAIERWRGFAAASEP
jgi:DNA-binding CsgD family transcriptional regulator